MASSEKLCEEIFPGIFRFMQTAENKNQGVGDIMIHIIRGKASGDRSLMIDCGFNDKSCRERLFSVLDELEIKPDMLDVFLTHRHHDHSGLAYVLEEAGSRIYMDPRESLHPYDLIAFIDSPESEAAKTEVIRFMGITETLCPEIYGLYRNYREWTAQEGKCHVIRPFHYTPVKEGDRFVYGDYTLRVMSLPGHSYGQAGLADDNNRRIFSADQVIHGVSPIVGSAYPDEGLLSGFFSSCAVFRRDYRDWTYIPAHGPVITDVTAETDAVLKSYLKKCDQASAVLKAHYEAYMQDKSRTARPYLTVREISERIYKLQCPTSPESFLVYKMCLSKIFSVLEFLYGMRQIDREMRSGIYFWTYKDSLELENQS